MVGRGVMLATKGTWERRWVGVGVWLRKGLMGCGGAGVGRGLRVWRGAVGEVAEGKGGAGRRGGGYQGWGRGWGWRGEHVCVEMGGVRRLRGGLGGELGGAVGGGGNGCMASVHQHQGREHNLRV